jgi:hypothetical protein
MSEKITGEQKNVRSSESAGPSALSVLHLASLLGSWRDHAPATTILLRGSPAHLHQQRAVIRRVLPSWVCLCFRFLSSDYWTALIPDLTFTRPGLFMKTTSSRVEQRFSPALNDHLERRLQPLGYMLSSRGGLLHGLKPAFFPLFHAGLKACSTQFMNNAIPCSANLSSRLEGYLVSKVQCLSKQRPMSA